MAGVTALFSSPTDDYICKRSEKQLKLLWQRHNCSTVTDMALLYDRSLLYITQPTDPEDRIKQLKALDAKGRRCDFLPFGGAFKSPRSIGANNDGKTVVLLDRIDGDESLIYVFQKERAGSTWSSTNIVDVVLMQWLEKVPPLGGLQISCTTYVDNLVVTFDERGKKLWDHRLADEVPNIDGKCIDADPDGNLVVCCPRNGDRNGSTIVIDRNGRTISMFPPELLHDPRGVCFTSNRHLLVSDWGSRGVFLFSVDWVFIRQVVRLDRKPTCLTLFADKLISIAFEDGSIQTYTI
ncbi:hypothetical protein LSH36_85g06011 [Paralvinella palmiformis]|uniref:Uncharacterized protein n=1 Tax=Paralvinella palmiformis TaxID=53620 RepID=A0AAD9K1D8_9ANNE|nr:hypothetical protein LSH36_85g06011 [Paralvinella palmiformis]